ncbi:MAG: hypothetical protein NC548_37805 [Lachnospiraceae bacterium]|nr:hypothetical protein [Lachnospiraceae bacterium]MCM1233010.1 hypothetical protein [Ruminococcus flavefaciens]
MSKKMNAENAAITATAEVTTIESATHGEEQSSLILGSLQSYFEAYPNASLRKLAQATEVNYGILLKKAKEPIPGEAYDPEATNWKAIEDKLTSKKIDWTTLDWNALNAGPNRKGSALQKDISAFKVGDKVYLRRNNSTPYEILYKTETHIVIMLEGTTEPQAWANNTFLINGPVFEPRAEKKTAEEPKAEEVAEGA